MSALPPFSFTVTERFLRYVQIDTQSDPASLTCPSTGKQKNLATLLVKELLEIGISDAEMDPHGYVYATIPATTAKEVPVICFCSHMDTSPDCSGENVKPLVHTNYQGQPLVLPDAPEEVLTAARHPELANKIGEDIITASGTTLLGADNKSGVAAIMDAARYLMAHPEVVHGQIRILFTPDEEIGRGADKVDLHKLGSAFGYTVDGETVGSLEDETFSADGAEVIVHGVSAHPGFAKGHLQSALKIAADIVSRLPITYLSPETTEDREGFIHPVSMLGTVEKATIQLILRDFTEEGLASYGELLRSIAREALMDRPGCHAEVHIREQYRNMKVVLDQHPEVVAYAEAAIQRAGITPMRRSIRGGTDGSRLSFMGLPCPNIFAGEHAFHSRQEWVSVQDMQKAVMTLVHLACIWEENS